MKVMSRFCLGALLPLLLGSLPAASQDQVRVSELTPLDRQYMQRQRDSIEISRAGIPEAGLTVRGTTTSPCCSACWYERLVRADEVEKLQAMGMLLGDVLAAQLDMHWVIYEDALGRSRALRYRETDNYLFPVTMISRRRAAGNDRPVQEIYDKAVDLIEPIREKLPYQ